MDNQVNEFMWNRILTMQVLGKVVGKTGDEVLTINQFFSFLKKKVEYKEAVVLATQWEHLEDVKQANIAIKMVGMYQASRFIVLMDVLSERFKEGKLK